MGNLQVRFLEGWAPAMAPGYSTLIALRHSLSRTYRKLGPSQLSQQHEGQIIPALWVVNPLSDGAGNHRNDVVERLVNLGH